MPRIDLRREDLGQEFLSRFATIDCFRADP